MIRIDQNIYDEDYWCSFTKNGEEPPIFSGDEGIDLSDDQIDEISDKVDEIFEIVRRKK